MVAVLQLLHCINGCGNQPKHRMSSNTTIAAFYHLPVEVVDFMESEKDAAAADFYAYPGEEWQFNFEESWLRERGHKVAADKAAECAAEVAAR
jgi:hypothetical protein